MSQQCRMAVAVIDDLLDAKAFPSRPSLKWAMFQCYFRELKNINIHCNDF